MKIWRLAVRYVTIVDVRRLKVNMIATIYIQCPAHKQVADLCNGNRCIYCAVECDIKH